MAYYAETGRSYPLIARFIILLKPNLDVDFATNIELKLNPELGLALDTSKLFQRTIIKPAHLGKLLVLIHCP